MVLMMIMLRVVDIDTCKIPPILSSHRFSSRCLLPPHNLDLCCCKRNTASLDTKLLITAPCSTCSPLGCHLGVPPYKQLQPAPLSVWTPRPCLSQISPTSTSLQIFSVFGSKNSGQTWSQIEVANCVASLEFERSAIFFANSKLKTCLGWSETAGRRQ